MTSAASYVTRALLVLGAIMNSLIALKYIAGSKASTVESLGPSTPSQRTPATALPACEAACV